MLRVSCVDGAQASRLIVKIRGYTLPNRAIGQGRARTVQQEKRSHIMPAQLPPLPFAPDALEPHIDRQTMEIHHGKHHQA